MRDKNVVVIGGGPGTDIALLGLKRHTASLTALISTFDAGTRGRLDHSVVHPSEEVRSSLLALGTDPATTMLMQQLFAYRFSSSPEIGTYNFGNLFLTALTEITGAADLALQAAARVLNVQGQVLPITLHDTSLVAELNDGSEVPVKTPAELAQAAAQVGVLRVRPDRPVAALGAALDAILQADIVVMGPADHYFGLLGPLQLEGMRDAIQESQAIKIFVCNMMTQPGLTGGWPASRFINSLLNYTGGFGSVDCVIVNSTPIVPDDAVLSAMPGCTPVRFDLEECLALGLNVIVRPVSAANSCLHDPEKLARTILFLGGGRSTRRSDKKSLFTTTPLNATAPAAYATSMLEQ